MGVHGGSPRGSKKGVQKGGPRGGPGGAPGGPPGGPPAGGPRGPPRAPRPGGQGRAPPGVRVWVGVRGGSRMYMSGQKWGHFGTPQRTPKNGVFGASRGSNIYGYGGYIHTPQWGVFLGGMPCLSQIVPTMFVPTLCIFVQKCAKMSKKCVPVLSRMGDLLNTQQNVQNSVPELSQPCPGGGPPCPGPGGPSPPGPPRMRPRGRALRDRPRAPRPRLGQGGTPWNPRSLACLTGKTISPQGPTPDTRPRSDSPLCTLGGRGQTTPLGFCTAAMSEASREDQCSKGEATSCYRHAIVNAQRSFIGIANAVHAMIGE